MIMIDRQSMSSMIRASKERPVSEEVHDRAVCMLLRLAAEGGHDVADVGLVCDVLGVSLDAALRRARKNSQAS